MLWLVTVTKTDHNLRCYKTSLFTWEEQLTLQDGQFTGAGSALEQPFTEHGYRCGGARSGLKPPCIVPHFQCTGYELIDLGTEGSGASGQLWEEARKWSLGLKGELLWPKNLKLPLTCRKADDSDHRELEGSRERCKRRGCNGCPHP